MQPVDRSTAAAADFEAPPAALSLTPRVGLEYLPPLEDTRAPTEHVNGGPRLQTARAPSLIEGLQAGRFADLDLQPGNRTEQSITVSGLGGEGPRTGLERPKAPVREVMPWQRSDAELAEVENPFERLTLNFLRNVVGKERRRVQRQLGAPLLFTRLRTVSTDHRLQTILDERDLEDQETLFRQHGAKLLNRPLRRTLRQSTFIQDLELILEDLKAETFPLSEAYQESHGDRWNLGRLSIRLRTSSGNDPVEMVYIRRGWRIGSSGEYLKVAYSMDLSEKVSFSLRSKYGYAADYLDLWGNLRYDANPDTRLHMLVGNNVDLLTGTTMYPIIRSPVVLPAADDSTGLLVYVEHFF